MIKPLVNIFVIIIFVACHPIRQITGTSSAYLQIIVNGDKSIVLGESISISIKNTYSNKIIIYYPEKLIIEKLEDGNWRKLKILECLCDAPCQASIDKIELEPGDLFEINWDQKESWCGPRSASQIRETIFKLATVGMYRVIFMFKSSEGIESSAYKNFNITQ